MKTWATSAAGPAGQRAAIVLFRGDPRREERQKELPARFLSTIHRSLLRLLSAVEADLFTIDGLGSVRMAGAHGSHSYSAATLGAVVDGAVRHCAAAGYSRVVLVAGDVVGLHRRAIVAALEALGRNERTAVIGGTSDGGFYVAGFNDTQHLRWEDILRTPEAAAASLASAATAEGFQILYLPTAVDIDNREAALRAVSQRTTTRELVQLLYRLASLLDLPAIPLTHATFFPTPAPFRLASLRAPPAAISAASL